MRLDDNVPALSLHDAALRALAAMDLTSLGETDSPERIRNLCRSALTPYGSPAAICVYPEHIEGARRALDGEQLTQVKIATVVNFPEGAEDPLRVKRETQRAVAAGADEIDVVMPYRALQRGELEVVHGVLNAAREASAGRCLKVIIESGELGDEDSIRRASLLAIEAGADFIKTSTGKVSPAATLPVTLLMLEVVRDWHRLTGERIGVKPAGGIRTSKDAIKYLVTVAETVGESWLQPHLFRFGASSLLNDVLLQRQKVRSGHYSGADYVTID